MSLTPPVVPISEMNERQVAEWMLAQRATPPKDVRRFTPTWTGFSADPPGDILYVDMGALVVLWVEPNLGTGTSDTTAFSFGTLPAAIRPTSQQQTLIKALNNSTEVLASLFIDTDGSVAVQIAEEAAIGAPNKTTFNSSGWWSSGQKGLSNTPIIYTKL